MSQIISYPREDLHLTLSVSGGFTWSGASLETVSLG